MDESIRAMVLTGPGTLELQTFARPTIGDDDALLRIEACGICGSDTDAFAGTMTLRYPVIPGHEPVGTIEAIGPTAAARWDLVPGDRVVMQSDFGCRRCRGCLDGQACLVSPGTYGFVPTTTTPALWGGYAELMYLAPGAVPFKIAPHVAPRHAALYNALGAGFAWAVNAPGLRAGETVAVLGPGQRGLACVIAAHHAGAHEIAVTGVGSRDTHKLALAAELGASLVIDVEHDDPVERVLQMTDGRGVDVVVDTTPHATQPVLDAVRMTRPGGTIVLAGLKGPGGVPGFPSDEIAMRWQTIKGVRAVDRNSFQQAVRLLESGWLPVERLHTHSFPLEQAADAVRALTDPAAHAIAITIEPALGLGRR
jgi:threonine dehydrogenase-like Zn-dependent dehydrogenase